MSEHLTLIPINMLVYSGRNPRNEMRGLEELAENIKEYGVLEPIIVRKKEEKFEIVVGERRVRASIMAGLKEIPTIVRAISDSQADELRLIENIHREDLTDAEKGDAIYALIENYPDKYQSIADVARFLGKSYHTVFDWTRKTRMLSDYVKTIFSSSPEQFTDFHARALLKYDHSTQDKLADVIVRKAIPTTTLPNFLKLYDTNPTANLDALADEAKGVKKVTVEVERLPWIARRAVKKAVKKREKWAEEMREKALTKAREAPRKAKPENRAVKLPIPTSLLGYIDGAKPAESLRTPQEEPTVLQQVPREDILKKTEGIIERLDEIKHPYQRERMLEVIPKELEKLEKRLEKAPERRERVEHKLNRLYELQAEGVFLSTLWDIGERAEYAGSKDFHGNCPPQVVEQCVLRLTKKGDVVLDPMAGSGTAIDVCNLLDRKCIAYDIKPPEWRNDIVRNDSRKIPLEDNSVDMIFLHPPYWDMVYYTRDEDEEKLSDLSRASTLEEYLRMLKPALQECYRVLKPKKYLCLLLGDRIKDGRFVPLCRKAVDLSEDVGFTDCGYAVKFTSGATSLMVKGQMIYAELAYTENLKIEHDLVMFFKKGEIENAQ